MHIEGNKRTYMINVCVSYPSTPNLFYGDQEGSDSNFVQLLKLVSLDESKPSDKDQDVYIIRCSI